MSTTWKELVTGPHLLETAGVVGMGLWGIYKKELQDAFKDYSKRAWARLQLFFKPPPASRVSDSQIDRAIKSGMGGLTSYLYLLLKEYAADRVTVTEYEVCADGTVLATMLSEACSGELRSILDDVQRLPIAPGLWVEIQRWHNQFLRARYVPDARLEDNAAFRDALLALKVCSGYYHTLPDGDGNCRAVLAMSWHDEHLLNSEQQRVLHLSGRACETVLLLMLPLKPGSKPLPKMPTG
jgi:hypothetical protein